MGVSRRQFLQTSSLALAAVSLRPAWPQTAPETAPAPGSPLQEFGYGSVTLTSPLHEAQRQQTFEVLMGISDDSLLKPFRQMVGQPAPGENLGGWYEYKADYNYKIDDAGLAPTATFGQWVSALARDYAITGDEATRDRVLRLNRLYAKTITPAYYEKNRFPAYCYDKLVCGLIDAHTFANDPEAFAILDQTTKVAAPLLPGRALDRDKQSAWRPGRDPSWSWDESYTMPENLFLAYQRGAGEPYRAMAFQYLDDPTYFDPLARGENALAGKHAYSYVNALSSGMQAYMVGGSTKHLHAVQNAFRMLQAQSFATGGWGPDEQLRATDSGDLGASLVKTHNSFETPCGSYAHFKVTRYLLRVTGDSRYGDSMEQVMYNTVLGSKALQPDGHAFYYADYNMQGARVFSEHRWPCCSGTLPQVAADYRINTYFRAANAVYVNLYIPSTLRWSEGVAKLSLQQKSDYPFESNIGFTLSTSEPVELSLHFRIPSWADGATLLVNGQRTAGAIEPGHFATVRRTWANGDRVDLELPLRMRTEAVDPQHPRMLALLQGPLVLFALNGAGALPEMTQKQLLEAQQSAPREWTAHTSTGPVRLVAFTDVGDRKYSTYVKTT